VRIRFRSGTRPEEMRGLVEQLDRKVERVELILTAKDPAAGAAAEAYDGLRKQIAGAVTARLAHMAQLAQLDAALNHGAGPETLRRMVDTWLEQAAVQRVTDPLHPQADVLFELVEDRGGRPVVLEPAYRDGIAGRVVRRGRIARPAAGGARR
jgi:hypothetical protein